MSPLFCSGLDLQRNKGGISRLTPQELASLHQSLPPILHIFDRRSMPGYSKGSRGLSVQVLVARIFTGTTISPSLLLRQWGSRYTIRAGRNLPDKEFRYLRTVIVTAAVYRGFNSPRRKLNKLTDPLNLPAPGRCQPLYVLLRVCRDLCFC